MIDRFWRHRLRYNRLEYKELAAQKIRDYFNKEYEPIQDIFLHYNELELIVEDEPQKVGFIDAKARPKSVDLVYTNLPKR